MTPFPHVSSRHSLQGSCPAKKARFVRLRVGMRLIREVKGRCNSFSSQASMAALYDGIRDRQASPEYKVGFSWDPRMGFLAELYFVIYASTIEESAEDAICFLSVRCPSINVYFAWRDISILVLGFQMKRPTYSTCDWDIVEKVSKVNVKGQRLQRDQIYFCRGSILSASLSGCLESGHGTHLFFLYGGNFILVLETRKAKSIYALDNLKASRSTAPSAAGFLLSVWIPRCHRLPCCVTNSSITIDYNMNSAGSGDNTRLSVSCGSAAGCRGAD